MHALFSLLLSLSLSLYLRLSASIFSRLGESFLPVPSRDCDCDSLTRRLELQRLVRGFTVSAIDAPISRNVTSRHVTGL